MPTIKITESVDIFSADPERIGKKDTMVSYTVDGVRTYIVILPSEEATPERIQEKIREAEAARSKVVGQEFEV